MKKSPSNPTAERPDGRATLQQQQQGYPDGPQDPSGVPCEGKPLRTPEQKQTAKATRNRVIKIRLTTEEMSRLIPVLQVKSGKRRGLSHLVRARLFTNRRQECSTYDCRQCRLLAAVINDLNLAARRSLQLATSDTAVQVLAQLASLEREIRNAFNIHHDL